MVIILYAPSQTGTVVEGYQTFFTYIHIIYRHLYTMRMPFAISFYDHGVFSTVQWKTMKLVCHRNPYGKNT